MALHFSPVKTPLRDLEVWRAESSEYSFAISRASRNGPGLHDKPGFIASWRSRYNNRPAITVVGSPFATLAEAEQACQFMLGYLSRRVI
jgi:hypothetical protein